MIKTSLRRNIYFQKNTNCPLLSNVGNSGVWVNFLAKHSENIFRDEAMAENGDKNEFITKELWFFKDLRRDKLSENLVQSTLFHSCKMAVFRNLVDPTYQKYVTTLSHDSEDIKNIENDLITKKPQALEVRRFYKILLSITLKWIWRKTTLDKAIFTTIFLHDRLRLRPSRT